MIQISAGEFKAKCLKLIDFAEQKHVTVVITKRGIPIAKLVPYEEKPTKLFGFLKGSVIIKGDILRPMDET
ncbi:MAG: prevent-host-death protein [Alphaproteobacteria bacterium 41-28]|nr:MAG: prevent-host-death protein [Alphaproteobacteria bacterium 41-28]